MPDPVFQLHDFVDLPHGPVLVAAEAHQDTEMVSLPHHHARGQLFGSLRGLLSVAVDDGMWLVPSIHALWVPPHALHSGRSHGPFHGFSVYVAESACTDLPKRSCTIRTSGLLREAVLRACGWGAAVTPLTESRAHVAAVILEEIRSLPIEPFGLPLPRDARLLRIAQAFVADPADDRDLERWAAWGCVSSRTLSRRFVAETGFNFTVWRQRARMMRSLQMLATGRSVTAIALELGYSTASAFIGAFKRTFGDTPTAYRTRL
jgi:AraC-like DNA-binding protein